MSDHARTLKLRGEYISRINRVVDHIESHLDQELSLEELARIACFSPYHFHRIFRALMGETCGQFRRRLRLEKAASLLVHQPDRSITEIALDCGFSGSETFARAFRETFRMSASEWRAGGHALDRKIGKVNDKGSQDSFVSSLYLDLDTGAQSWTVTSQGEREMKAAVTVKELQDMHVAYIRHVGPYKGDAKLFAGLFERLMKWAGPRDLLRFPTTLCMSVYHDDPKVTDEEKLRTSICLTVPAGTEVDGEVGKMTIPGGKYAVANFTLSPDQYEQAWQAVYGGWLPESGYQPDDRPSFEIYRNNPDEHPERKCIVDICIPVKPL